MIQIVDKQVMAGTQSSGDCIEGVQQECQTETEEGNAETVNRSLKNCMGFNDQQGETALAEKNNPAV